MRITVNPLLKKACTPQQIMLVRLYFSLQLSAFASAAGLPVRQAYGQLHQQRPQSSTLKSSDPHGTLSKASIDQAFPSTRLNKEVECLLPEDGQVCCVLAVFNLKLLNDEPQYCTSNSISSGCPGDSALPQSTGRGCIPAVVVAVSPAPKTSTIGATGTPDRWNSCCRRFDGNTNTVGGSTRGTALIEEGTRQSTVC